MRALLSLVFVGLLGCGARTGIPCDGCATDPGGGLDGSTDPDVSVDGFEVDIGLDVLDDAPATDLGGSTDACPSALPKDGTSCAGALSCTYIGCDASKPDRATCVAGKWSVTSSACTTTATDRCPLTVAADGAACTISDHTACIWSVHCAGDTLGFCRGGRWAVKPSGCAAPFTCPARPVAGAACSITPSVCSFIGDCGVTEEWTCVSGVWSGTPALCGGTPECPAIEPPTGASCSPGSRPLCAWKNGCGGVDYGRCGWFLGEGQWTIFRPPCPTSGCPESPDDGASCSSAGRTCTYPIGGGCSMTCACGSGRWSCAQRC